MPPKPHKTPAKPKQQPPVNNVITLSKEQEQQFEVELCWCIQQLQAAIGSGKVPDKQVQDHVKSLNALMSNTTPLVKKRQIMRLSFGDYREKMAMQEQKSAKSIAKIKVQAARPSKKSKFVKKSTLASSFGGDNFQFNFTGSNDQELSQSLSEVDIADPLTDRTEVPKVEKQPFVHTDNSFRFNFQLDVTN